MTIDTSQNLRALISQYQPGTAEHRLASAIQRVLQAEWGDPLNALSLDIDTATGFQLTVLGARLGYTRPPVSNTDVVFFGFRDHPDSAGFGEGPFATSDPSLQAFIPIDDVRYRQMLKARGLLLRSGATRATIEAQLTHLVGAGAFRMTESDAISFARTPQLAGMTRTHRLTYGITAAGRRYRIDPVTGAYTRLTGDMPSRAYSSLSYGRTGDLYAISGASYYTVDWTETSVSLSSGVAITGLDASSGISGPTPIDDVEYIATPTSLYTVDFGDSPAATRIGAFAPATTITGLTAIGKTLYASDASGAIRSVDVGTAATTLYHSTGASSLSAIMNAEGALYASSASRLYVIDSAIKANPLSFSVDVTHSDRDYLDKLTLDAEFVISRPAGVARNFRAHIRD